MNSVWRVRLATIALAFITQPWLLYAQQAQQPTDLAVYQRFRQWVTNQPATGSRIESSSQQTDTLNEYAKVLASQGVPSAEIERRLRVIRENGPRLEIELWNRVFALEKPTFNTQPNAFLVRMTKDIKPGTALDYGMGQGRNALYLAQQGWTVTGFDPAEKGVALAQENAAKLGVKITALAVRDDQFDFGIERYDLILLSYVTFREMLPKIHDSLKTGGIVVVEAFHRDSTKNGPAPAGVVWDTNELLKLFERFRIVQYEDVDAATDWGTGTGRVVRLVAQKQ